jgi:Xaa-Pro dipeptidase
MRLNRRAFFRLSAAATAAAAAFRARDAEPSQAGAPPAGAGVPEVIRRLKPMTDGIVPITDEERKARIEKARRLMAEHKIDAVYLESGTGLFYFTGVRWGGSERMFAAVLPARGDLAWVCPKFEEDRARELIRFGSDIRTWEEDEDPGRVVAQILKDRGIATGTVGIEERARFFLYDMIRKAAPALQYVIADPVTVGCRVIKTPAEIALMQRAADITIAAYRAAVATFHEGMTRAEFSANAAAAHRALGAEGSIGAGFGELTALPHGSVKPRTLREGDIVLMDGGCKIDGYSSDISRTVVFGKPTQRQKDVWDLEKRAQAAAFAAAKPGVPCEAVDAAARKVITDAGFGPGYKVPGLPHRTGHGIGLDGHEQINLVRGNTTPLAPGMCFSNEPMIAIPGEFGVRLEDCMYITPEGARFFSQPSPSIDQPCA